VVNENKHKADKTNAMQTAHLWSSQFGLSGVAVICKLHLRFSERFHIFEFIEINGSISYNLKFLLCGDRASVVAEVLASEIKDKFDESTNWESLILISGN